MVVLRRTRKLERFLPASARSSPASDTALGDWYVNRLTVDRQPLLLLVSSHSLLPALIPAREVRSLPDRLPEIVALRLQRLAVAPSLIDAELAAMASVAVGPTVDRSVVGIMVDFAKLIPYHLQPGAWDHTMLPSVEASLADTPCHVTRRFEDVVFPYRKAPELLLARWSTA